MKKFLKQIFAGCLSIFLMISLVGVIVGVVIFYKKNNSTQFNQEKVLFIDFAQDISDYAPVSKLANLLGDSQMPTTLQLIKTIENAAHDDRIEGIFYNGSSNIGQASSMELLAALDTFKNHNKFIYSYGSYYSQGSYLLASKSDRIFINPSGKVDLKGYAYVQYYLKDFFTKFHVDVNVFVAGKYKSYIEQFTRNDMSQENKEQTERFIESLMYELSSGIAANRTLDRDSVLAICHGSLAYNAERSVALGLADSILYKSDFITYLADQVGVPKDKVFMPIQQYYQIIENEEKHKKSDNQLAIVYLEGEITDMPGKGMIDEKTMRQAFNEVRENENIKVIILRINSPGGSAYASEEMWHEVELCKEKNLPVIVSMGKYAASGGYYVACGADKIFANHNTLTGSIGAFTAIFNFEHALDEHFEVHMESLGTGPFSAGTSSFLDLTEEQRERFQLETDMLYNQFKSRVAKGRNMTMDEVELLAQGKIYPGDIALENGLIDTIGQLQDAIQYTADIYDINPDNIEIYPKVHKSIKEDIENMFQIDYISLKFQKNLVVSETINAMDMLVGNKGGMVRMPYFKVN